jgi:hypothetical protein
MSHVGVIMKIGTKSLLFGVHQFAIHPIMVLWAWWIIYRRFPCLYELFAIITHDWGYWGSSNMDGEEGTEHPERIAQWWRENGGARSSMFYWKIADEIAGHSRFHVAKYGGNLSRLFRADKLATVLYPRWLYLLLANLSGEIKEYMEVARKNTKYTVDTETQTRWLLGVQAHMIMMGLNNDTKHNFNQVEQFIVIPCPFCGEEPRVVPNDSYEHRQIFCVCEHEPLVQLEIEKSSYNDLVKLWNKRAL